MMFMIGNFLKTKSKRNSLAFFNFKFAYWLRLFDYFEQI